jgi:o-succinylbenzoate synthase
VRCFRLPLVAPLATAHGVIAVREGALLELATAAGRRGFGEAMPLRGFGLEGFDAARSALGSIAAALLGRDLRDLVGALACIAEVAPRAPAARAAADVAVHDLAARCAGVSVASLLAGERASRACVRASALVAADEPAVAAQCAVEFAAAGYATLKLKIGRDLDRDCARVAAVRAAIGDRVALRLDANGAFDEREAAIALERFARFAPAFVEQPLATHDVAAWTRLRSGAPVAIAADESVCDAASARALLDRGGADWIVLKPAALGGLAATLKIAADAHACGVRVVVTSFLDSALGRNAALQLAAALPNEAEDAGVATGALLSDDLAHFADAPRIALHDAVGLGVAPDPRALARLATGAASELAA